MEIIDFGRAVTLNLNSFMPHLSYICTFIVASDPKISHQFGSSLLEF